VPPVHSQCQCHAILFLVHGTPAALRRQEAALVAGLLVRPLEQL
jgi:hypothetical protein